MLQQELQRKIVLQSVESGWMTGLFRVLFQNNNNKKHVSFASFPTYAQLCVQPIPKNTQKFAAATWQNVRKLQESEHFFTTL